MNAMKIWIDLTNSPQVNFFKPFILKWKSRHIELIITTRDLANTIDLIEQNNWKYEEIGGHAGKNKLRKVLYFPRRILLLRNYLKDLKPDIGISHISFYSPLVCKLLRIPSIYLNDNEHAKGNYFAFRYASICLLPEYLKEISYKNKWSKKYTISFYPGIKEGIYLSQYKNLNKSSSKKYKKNIYIRPEPLTAEYYSGGNYFIDELIKGLKDDYNIVLLPRNAQQVNHYKKMKINGMIIVDKPLQLEDIRQDCDLFIGAGGSMTREIAYFGIPTISVYQGELLEVDKYLINNNMMHYRKALKKDEVDKIMYQSGNDINSELYQKGLDAFNMINSLIDEYGKN